MKLTLSTLLLCAVLCAQSPASFEKAFDNDLKSAEGEIVSLAEAMPAEKFNFVPTGGAFDGVRSFGQQMSHIAAVNYEVAAALLGEKNPSDMGKSENGPDSLDNKDAIVKYLKDSFAYAHKAMHSITAANALGEVKSPFGGKPTPRVSLRCFRKKYRSHHALNSG